MSLNIEKTWSSVNPLSVALLPLSWLFRLISATRRMLYRRGWLASVRLPAPVVVIGNISVGGTGKTPLTVEVVALARRAGYRPGVISRGYGGRSSSYPLLVRPDSSPTQVGDEPLLLARRCGCPVAVDPVRSSAGRLLLEQEGCDLLVADDGLQHYRLQRDVEIAVIDGERRFGNGWCLPAGPLREPVSRLGQVQLRVCNGGRPRPGELAMRLVAEQALPVISGPPGRSLHSFRGERVHGVAAIGHPQRFFASLRAMGLEVAEHPFPDHHAFRPEDLDFGDGKPILMTEKDAVKCEAFAGPEAWFVPVRAQLPAEFENGFLQSLRRGRYRPGQAHEVVDTDG